MSIKKILDASKKEITRIAAREVDYYRTNATYALLFMTYRCTSRCQMCSIWRRKVDIREELTYEQWRDAIDSLYEMGVRHIEFFGGDALLRKDVLIPLIAYSSGKNIYTELPTNCNLIDEGTAEDLVNAGLDAVWISLDGIEGIHDGIRGKDGTFKRVHRAIEQLRAARGEGGRPKISINCVITKGNVENFERIIPYAKDMGIDGIDIEYVGVIDTESISKTELCGLHPTPFFTSEGSSTLLDDKGATLLKEKLEGIREGRRRNGLNVNTIKVDILRRKDIIAGRYHNKRCYICRNWVTIDPYGNVIGCLHYNNYYLGNIKEEAFSTIWRGEKHGYFIAQRDSGKFDICNYCSNGAVRNSTPLQSFQNLYYEILRKGRE
jgi:radical SAM protein with 4Fe4S-binding SPASM domain